LIIPKEQSVSFQRWEVASLNTKQLQPTTEAKVAPSPAPLAQETHLQELPQLPTQEEIELIYEEARQQGHAAGFAEGKAEHEAIIAKSEVAHFEHFSALIENLQSALSTIDQTVADQLLLLAIEIAGQVCRSNIAVKKDVLLPIIREAITALPLHHAHLVLRLNPQDAENVREHLGEQFLQNGTKIIEDNTITVGGCQLQAGASEVDASIETRWKRVLEAIGTEPQTWLTS
jgi:flagellar assembly protein FliH